MADFKTSTHRSKWIFTPQELCGVTRLEVDIDGSVSFPKPLNELNNKDERRSLPKPLNGKEEKFMHVFYEQKIQEVCEAFHFPHKIQGTAILYFKRFYLQWSVMEHHPKQIMLTCIYTSCKIEENHISAEEMGKGIQQDPQMILNNEMLVLQSLGFDLIVYAPYRSIEGFVDDMEEFTGARDDELHKFMALRITARVEVDRIMLTDAPLLFPPGQLALAGLRRSNGKHEVLDFERYLESLFSRQQSSRTILELMESLKEIDFLVGKLQFPTGEEMKLIDRKLKSCRDKSSHEKKREKRSKHKSKRTASEMEGAPAE